MNFTTCKSCGQILLEGHCFKHDDCLVRRVSATRFNYRIFTKEQGTFQEISLLCREDHHQRSSLNTTNAFYGQAASHSCKGNMNSKYAPEQHQSAFMEKDLGNVSQEFPFASHNGSYSILKTTERFPLRPRPIFFSPMHQNIQKNLGQASNYNMEIERPFPSHNERFPIPNLFDANERNPVIPWPAGSASMHSNIQTNTRPITKSSNVIERPSNAQRAENSNICRSFSNRKQLPLISCIESEQQKEDEADKLPTSGASRQLICDNPGNDLHTVDGPSRLRHDEHICPECGTEFPSKSELERHSVVHFRELPFICDVCHEEFPRQILLNRHMRIHTGGKPIICEICGKAFGFKSYLKRHALIHTGEKSFTCGTCGKAFTYEQDLKRHALIHTGEKPFLCKICGKAFRQRSTLKEHAHIHNKKNVQCKLS